MINWLDRVGDWNPQLLRELKGRLKSRNLLIAIAISFVGQFFLLLFFQIQLPIGTQEDHMYCTGNAVNYVLPNCVRDAFDNFVINWQLWWLGLFVLLSVIGIFALIVVGTYLLISDLAHEERRDTLNFIRLSPQASESILVGKLLGVPILLYLVAVLAVPLHLWAGLSAQIPLIRILSFYGVLIAACLCFYSAALLFSLVSSWLGGFQAWLGSGGVLILLAIASFKPIKDSPFDWLNLFSPSLIIQYLVAATNLNLQSEFSRLSIGNLQWFSLPVGAGMVGVVSSLLLNYGLWTYWSWQALKRRFPNPSKTMLSKRQSYLLVACFEVVLLGFAVVSKRSNELLVNFQILLVINLLLFLSLIVVLTPGRQTLQDWARHSRQQASSRNLWNRLLMSDLVWGEKSPALVAIAINLAIASAILVPWIVFSQDYHKLQVFLSLVISCNLTLIYAAITQLIMLMPFQKQFLWVIGTLGAVIGLPTVIVVFLFSDPSKIPGLWLVTPFAGFAIEYASATTVFLALLCQWSILTLLTLQITRQLRKAGESASKTLFTADTRDRL